MVKLASRILCLLAVAMTIAVAQSDASTVYDQVFASPTTIKCNSDISCSILDHIRVQAVTYGGVPGTGFYTWDGVDACSPDGAFYIQPSGAAHCFVMDGFSGTGVPLSNALANTKILVGNASNVAAAVNMSGDATIANTGAVTLANSGVTAGTYTPGSVTVDAKGRVTSANSTLPSADIFVGNGSNVSAPVAVSGDATLANTGALTVSKSQGSQIVTTVPSISALSALGSPSSIAHVNVQAYTAGGTSGGGVFDYSSAALTDNSCTIVPASDGKHWVREGVSTFIRLSWCDTLAHADTLAAASSLPLQIDQNVTLTGNTVLTSPCLVYAGGIITRSTFTLSLKCMSAPDVQVFDTTTSSSGAITFSKPIPLAYPEWWGAKGDHTTDDTYPLNAFFAAFSANGGYLAMHRGYKTTAQILMTYSGGVGQNWYLNASGSYICPNGAYTAVKINSASNYGGPNVYGLTIDQQDACSSGLSTGGIDLYAGINARCDKCVVLVKSANTAATYSCFKQEDDGTNGSYWSVLNEPLCRSFDTYIPTAYTISNNDNAAQLLGAQCQTVTTCVALTGSNGDPNGVVIDRLFAEDLQSYMIHGTTNGSAYISGLRVTNCRLEPRNGITMFKFDGTASGPNYGGDPVSFYVSNCFSVVPITGTVTQFDTPSGMIYNVNGTRYQRTDIAANSTQQVLSLAQASRTTPGMAGTAGILNCEFQSTGNSDATSYIQALNATGQGTTDAGRTSINNVTHGTLPITNIGVGPDPHGTNQIVVQATAYASNNIQSLCSFNGVSNFTP